MSIAALLVPRSRPLPSFSRASLEGMLRRAPPPAWRVNNLVAQPTLHPLSVTRTKPDRRRVVAYTDAGAQAPPRLRGLNWGWGKHISESARLELPLHLRNTRCPFANEKPRFAPGRTARAQAVARARAVHPRYQLPRQPTGSRLHTMRHCASRCIGPFLHLMQMHSTALALQCTMQMMQVGSNASRCKMQNNASLVASQCGIVAYRGKYEQPALFFCYSIS